MNLSEKNYGRFSLPKGLKRADVEQMHYDVGYRHAQDLFSSGMPLSRPEFLKLTRKEGETTAKVTSWDRGFKDGWLDAGGEIAGQEEEEEEIDMNEGRDDISKLPIPASGKANARKSGLKALRPPTNPKLYQKMIGDLTMRGRSKKNFQNVDVGQTTGGGKATGMGHAMKGYRKEALEIVERLLD